MTKYPQTLLNVPIKNRFDPHQVDSVQQAISKVEAHLGERGRILLRASGTEPLIRVMVEGEDSRETGELAEELAKVVQAAESEIGSGIGITEAQEPPIVSANPV